MANKTVRTFGALLSTAVFLCGCGPKATAEDADLWQNNLPAALKQAQAEKKHVLVDFSGSDWCGWCIKLDKEVFSQPEFVAYAQENLVCVLIDFPRSKPQAPELKAANQALAEKYRVAGFPTVLILDPQGKVLESDGYQSGGAAKYVDFIKGVIAGAK